MESKRIKQEHSPLGASSLAGKIDIEQITNAVEFCGSIACNNREKNMCPIVSGQKGKMSCGNDVESETWKIRH